MPFTEASGECHGWYRARIDELPGRRFHAKIQTLQRARAEQHEITGLAEHDVVSRCHESLRASVSILITTYPAREDGKVVKLEEQGTSPWTAEYRGRQYDSSRVKIPLPNF